LNFLAVCGSQTISIFSREFPQLIQIKFMVRKTLSWLPVAFATAVFNAWGGSQRSWRILGLLEL
jgi:hypothetical protein